MLRGVDRLVDLSGAASDGPVADAVRCGDAAALAAVNGHFAAVARDGQTVRLARTIGMPLRYFVAKMYHGPFLVVADRIDRLFEWCREQRIAWQFDPAYTRMVPAHHLVELDQVGCPDPVPRYQRFFNPPVGVGAPDVDEGGERYIRASISAATRWLRSVPDGQPIALAFSGGIDSTAILLMARAALADLGRNPDFVRPFTLDLGGGADAIQAEQAVSSLGLAHTWERIEQDPSALDLEEAIRVIEDYHPLDVECAATSLALLRGIRQRHPEMRWMLDGDGGDENLKSYPLADSDLTISSVLSNPLLYQEGWGVDAIKHSVVYSGGLSRGYVRTCAPAAACGFTAFSPFTTREVIAEALAIPFATLAAGDGGRLEQLKLDIVSSGIRRVLGIDMPVNPKRRFQDGASSSRGERVTKAWCRRTFDRQWRERLAEAESIEWRSGNEVMVPR
jgi:asparagine synthase (glutamine-hydrolysing)